MIGVMGYDTSIIDAIFININEQLRRWCVLVVIDNYMNIHKYQWWQLVLDPLDCVLLYVVKG